MIDNERKKGTLPNKELEEILVPLTNGMQDILSDKFLGAYLGGSFAHGGWDEYSDVDFNVVIASDLTPYERDTLKVLHARIFIIDSYWARHLEGAYFPREILGDLTRTDEPLWYLDNGSLNFERSTHDNTLVNRWVLRERGVILAGPPPKTWIPEIPTSILKAEVFQTMRHWGQEILEGRFVLDNGWVQAFAVLSYCRMLQTLDKGEINSKPAGVHWAKANLNSTWFGLIDNALAERPDQYEKYYSPSDPDKVKETLAFIRYCLDFAKKHWQIE
ncbi:MAG: aminoglycoside adenylyltransferase domain-containing protein [Anaerolineales bacterium]